MINMNYWFINYIIDDIELFKQKQNNTQVVKRWDFAQARLGDFDPPERSSWIVGVQTTQPMITKNKFLGIKSNLMLEGYGT